MRDRFRSAQLHVQFVRAGSDSDRPRDPRATEQSLAPCRVIWNEY
ncbi:hypothetical protein [Rubidibacter lacunae]|nr:hypothetical protein [Rubidibacter lacunae]